MDVDKSRGERESLAGDAFVCVTIGEIADGDDPAVGDGDVGRERRTAGAVIDAGSLEDRPEQRLT
jgi:hypothetical protein